ncbi:MAG: sigma-54-dependent Fis family transcriptional regulator, partial [Bacteroidales bacterium]|nr:sigma-54-dependent Fis family transcriptional regulator [Bacteroidales bacterium]
QTGEFIKVGSSKVQKTDVRVIAATNKDLSRAVEMGKFREDLFYRLNTVPIKIPPLRERKEDIYLLFRKFVSDFTEKYTVPTIRLTDDAVAMLEAYRWPGNVRQLKSVADQISVLETNRVIDATILAKYLPVDRADTLPVRTGESNSFADYGADRDIIFKILFQLRRDVDDLKDKVESGAVPQSSPKHIMIDANQGGEPEEKEVTPVDTLSIQDSNVELIKRAIEKHGGRRKAAAEELGISERTLYRKIKQYGLEE